MRTYQVTLDVVVPDDHFTLEEDFGERENTVETSIIDQITDLPDWMVSNPVVNEVWLEAEEEDES